MAKIYVASSWRNIFHDDMVSFLRKLNHEVYDYRNPAPGNHGFTWDSIEPNWEAWTFTQYLRNLSHPKAEEGYGFDIGALNWCDICVLVLPSGDSAHIEAGYAKGAGKGLIIYMPGMKKPDLMYKMADAIVNTPLCVDEAIERIDLVQRTREV